MFALYSPRITNPCILSPLPLSPHPRRRSAPSSPLHKLQNIPPHIGARDAVERQHAPQTPSTNLPSTPLDVLVLVPGLMTSARLFDDGTGSVLLAGVKLRREDREAGEDAVAATRPEQSLGCALLRGGREVGRRSARGTFMEMDEAREMSPAMCETTARPELSVGGVLLRGGREVGRRSVRGKSKTMDEAREMSPAKCEASARPELSLGGALLITRRKQKSAVAALEARS